MVPACSVKVPRVSTYSGYRHVNSSFAYGAFTLSGWLSQNHSARLINQLYGPNPSMHARWFGLFRFRSPLLPESHVVFSSSGYLDVSVHRVPLHTLWIGVWMIRVLRTGFPHSDICGSRIICISPQLFAAYHVFLRLLVPRHPPCALIRLTFCSNVLAYTSARFVLMNLLVLVCFRIDSKQSVKLNSFPSNILYLMSSISFNV